MAAPAPPAATRRRKSATDSVRVSSADGFGAGMVDPSEVASRGTGTAQRTPLEDLQSTEQRWSVANRTTIAGNGAFGYFSAVCS